jgi:formate hydrogenlyase subunit 4
VVEPQAIALGLLQGTLVLLLSPGLLGLVRWVKARAQGRGRGLAGLWMPYLDLIRLLGQRPVRSQRTHWVFAAAPLMLGAVYGTLAFAVPLLGWPPLLRIDLIAFIYLLALARFALALGGMDGGAPFGALGGGRSMFVNLPAELALVLIGAALFLHHHTLILWDLMGLQGALSWQYLLSVDLLLAFLALLSTIGLEAGRIPIDNPATPPALTIGQKAVTLEYAGRDLALIDWAESVKLSVLLILTAALFLTPLTGAWPASPQGSLGALLILILLVAMSEAGRPKLRLRKVVEPGLLSAGFGLMAILYQVIVSPLVKP